MTHSREMLGFLQRNSGDSGAPDAVMPLMRTHETLWWTLGHDSECAMAVHSCGHKRVRSSGGSIQHAIKQQASRVLYRISPPKAGADSYREVT